MADKRKYILATFLKACSNSRHHHRWMDADTWAKVIAMQYNLDDWGHGERCEKRERNEDHPASAQISRNR